MEISDILTGREYIEKFTKEAGNVNGLLNNDTVKRLSLENQIYFVDVDGRVVLACHEDVADSMLDRLMG